MTVGQVIAKLGVDPKEYEKGLRQAERQADKAGTKIGNIFKNAFSVTIGVGMFEALKKGFKSTVGTAISFNSMLQTAQIGFATMLGSAEKAQKFLEDMADFAVRTPFEYPELLEATKRMLAYGFAAEEVLPTLRAVGDASAALGSGSVGIDRITLALGQIQAKGKLSAEEMRQLTEAGIPAWEMLAEAMGTTVPALQDMVSKGLVPGAKAVEMLTNGMTKRFGGMMASMEDTWQGVTSSIKDIWRMTVGTLTQNLFGGLNAMLIKVRDFLSQFYSILNAVMGKKAKQTTDGLVQSTEEQAGAMSDVGDATEAAAKKAKKNLQTFDEVHQLQEDMSDTAAGGMLAMPETGAMAPFEMEDAGEPETFTKMQEMLEKLAVLFDPAIEGFNRLKTAAEPVITSIGEGLKWFYDNVLVPFGTWIMAEAVPAFFDLLSGSLTIINPILEALQPLGQWLWDSFLQPIASWTGQAFVDSINFVSDALKDIGNWMSDNKSIIEGITIAVAAFFAAWKITELMAFIQMAGGVVTAIKLMTTAIWSNVAAKLADKAETVAIIALYAKDFIVSLAKGVASLATSTGAWIANTAAKAANTVAAWAAVAGQVALTAATTAWSAICTAATAVTTALGVAFNFLMSPITLVVLAIAAVIAIVVLLIKHWDEVSAAAVSAWEWIKETWAVVAGWFDKNIIQPVAKFFADLWNGIKDIWGKVVGWFNTHVIRPLVDTFNGLKTKITGIWDGIWGGIKSVVNSIIGGINTLIKGLNKLHFDIPDWVPGIGGKGFGISIPLIPKLAAGTNYIPQDMFAYLHEGEAVVPKKYNPAAGGGITAEAIEQAMYRTLVNFSRIAQASTRTEHGDFVVRMNSREVARETLPEIIRELQRQGFNLIIQPQGV